MALPEGAKYFGALLRTGVSGIPSTTHSRYLQTTSQILAAARPSP
jgi:hypothetical protein